MTSQEAESDKATRWGEQIEKDETKRREDIAKCNEEISQIQGRINNPPSMPEQQADIDRDDKQLGDRERNIASEQDELNQKMGSLNRDEQTARRALENETKR